jgi:hypothetical protein
MTARARRLSWIMTAYSAASYLAGLAMWYRLAIRASVIENDPFWSQDWPPFGEA